MTDACIKKTYNYPTGFTPNQSVTIDLMNAKCVGCNPVPPFIFLGDNFPFVSLIRDANGEIHRVESRLLRAAQ